MGKRTGIMLFYPFEEKRLLKWQPPFIVQPKLDGERCRALEFAAPGYGSCHTLLSSEENQFNFAVPHILKAYEEVCRSIHTFKYPEIDGELYNHEIYLEGGFEAIHSIVSRTTNLHPDYHKMEFHYFDMIDMNSQWARLKELDSLQLPYPFVKVPRYIAETFDDIMRIYDKILEMGYEGIIVRHCDAPYVKKRSIYGMKFKPKKSDIYKIVGYKQMVDKNGVPKDRLGSFICIGPDGHEFSVGSGMDDEFRIKNWPPDDLIGLFVKVEYQHITSGKGVPRFPIFVSIQEAEPEIELF